MQNCELWLVFLTFLLITWQCYLLHIHLFHLHILARHAPPCNATSSSAYSHRIVLAAEWDAASSGELQNTTTCAIHHQSLNLRLKSTHLPHQIWMFCTFHQWPNVLLPALWAMQGMVLFYIFNILFSSPELCDKFHLWQIWVPILPLVAQGP